MTTAGLVRAFDERPGRMAGGKDLRSFPPYVRHRIYADPGGYRQVG
jgi:hypothetical protein